VTRIDFYVLKDAGASAGQAFACRLAEKVFRSGHRIYIHAGSSTQLAALDDLLWTFRAGSFLPHALYKEKDIEFQPILLGHAVEPAGCSDVLFNLANEVPSFLGRFSRVAELVAGDEKQRTAARGRYRFYKDRGYDVHTHDIN